MADIHITKAAAAVRQLDAAIRILFAKEDQLAIHTVAAAAHQILTDLANQTPSKAAMQEPYEYALRQLQERFPGKTLNLSFQDFQSWIQREQKRPANFLKHTDRDARSALIERTLDTDHLLLEACTLYIGLGFEPTAEIRAFSIWHRAVYPSEEEDRLETAIGYVHDLERTQKLECGEFLIQRVMELAKD